jgi:hypothetical protein
MIDTVMAWCGIILVVMLTALVVGLLMLLSKMLWKAWRDI